MAVSESKSYINKVAIERNWTKQTGNKDIETWKDRQGVELGSHGTYEEKHSKIDKYYELFNKSLNEEELRNLRHALIHREAALKQRQSVQETTNIAKNVEKNDTEVDLKQKELNPKWKELTQYISTGIGTVQSAVTSRAPSMPTLSYISKPKDTQIESKLTSMNALAEKKSQIDSIPELTDTQYHETTRKLIGDLKEQVSKSYKDTSSCIKPLEALVTHLHKYAWRGGATTKDAALKQILLLRHKCDESQGISLLIQESLGLLGYHEPPTGPGIRILAIDGGGTRGIVACRILQALEEGTGQPIHKLFDLICGVSTGAILAAFLGFDKKSAQEVEKIYADFSVQVFNQNFLYGAKGLVSSHSYYDSKGFEDILKKLTSINSAGPASLMQHYRNKDMPKIAMVATDVTDARLSPYVFRSYQLPRKTHTRYQGSSRHDIWAAVRASTAAPGYFDEFVIGDKVFQDGGILVNNPTHIAVHEAQKLWPDYPIQCVMSLGLGRTDKFMQDVPIPKSPTRLNLSLKQKFDRIVDSATDTEMIHLTMEDLLTTRGVYYRFNPYLKEFTYLDDTREQQFNMMREYSRMYIRRNSKKFSDACYQLTKEKGPHHRLKDFFHRKLDLLKAHF